MSRYQIDKVLRSLVQDEEAQTLYRVDRPALLERFDLTETERAAFMTTDLATLYRLGAHYFILWGAFARLAERQEDFRREYLSAIGDLGYPDYET